MRMIRLLVAVLFAFGVVAVAEPVEASVGNSFTFVHYQFPNKVFAYANSGTAHAGFRAYVTCGNGGVGTGAWQTQPGPWLGSTASCGNEAVTGWGVRFF